MADARTRPHSPGGQELTPSAPPACGTVATTACGVRARSAGRMLISLILRALPFWIREPLVIAVSLFFAGLALCY